MCMLLLVIISATMTTIIKVTTDHKSIIEIRDTFQGGEDAEMEMQKA